MCVTSSNSWRPAGPTEDIWFWDAGWQQGEREVNQSLQNGEYAVFDSPEDLLADLRRHV
jgi:hypothetical protein